MKCQQTGRCLLLIVCTLQMISTGERQLFDFLGRMWLPILFNFFNIIFVIFGFFGAYQYKAKYIIIYLSWMVLWFAWNTFIICFYLNVGSLNNQTDLLNFGTGSASWWEVNGAGCDPIYPTNLTQIDILRPLRPNVVRGCLLDYEYVETVHAAFQIIFCIMAITISLYSIHRFRNRSENCKKEASSIYYVEYSSATRNSESPDLTLENMYQRPMTPRKVKRHNRNRSSGRSQGSSSRGTQNRNSQWRASQSSRTSRNSRRPLYLNPVSQILNRANESSTDTESFRHPLPNRQPFSSGVNVISGRQGHSNPTYVHSRQNSTNSVNSPDPVERPPSVHSSYSNYHGQRPSLNPNPTGGGYRNLPSATNGYRNSALLGNHSNLHRKNAPKSTFRPEIRALHHDYSGSSLATSYYGDTGSECDRPPPYMFGVNSETVI